MNDLLERYDATIAKQKVDSERKNEDIAIETIEAKAKATKDEPTLGSETARAVFGGVRDAAQGGLDLIDQAADFLNSKVPIPYQIEFGNDNNRFELSDLIPEIKKVNKSELIKGNPFVLPEIDKNETIAGKIGRDLTRFITGMVIARKGMSSFYTKGMIKKLGEKGVGGKLSRLGETLTSGVLGSQIVSKGDEGRLADLLIQIPALRKNEEFNKALEYLQTNPNDDEAQARVKMAIEDVVVALPIEGGLALARNLFKGSQDPVAQEIANQSEDILNNALIKETAKDNPLDVTKQMNKIMNMPPKFSKEKVAGLPDTNINFVNKAGEPLFSGADDGVEDLVLEISNKLKEARARGTGTTNEQTITRAKNLGLTDDVLKKLPKNISSPELATATRMLFVTSANNVKRIADEVVKDSSSRLRGTLELALIRHRAIQEKLAGMAANAGRTLQAFNINIGDDVLLKSKHLDDLAEAFGGDTTKIARAISQGGDSSLKSVLDSRFTSSFTDRLNQIIYFNYLSNPSTYFINAIGNLGTNIYETLVALPVGATVSAVRKGKGKLADATRKAFGLEVKKRDYKDSIYFREVLGRMSGTAQSTIPAVKNFFKSAYNFDLPPELKRMTSSEYEEFVQTGVGKSEKSGLLAKATGTVLRIPATVLLGTDAFFKTLAKGAFVHQMAYREAAKRGYGLNPNQVIKGKTQAQFIKEFLEKPRPVLEKAALDDAARVTFTKDGKIARAVSKVKRVKIPIGDEFEIPIGSLVNMYLPFIRTPLNLLEYSMENSLFAKMTPGYGRAMKKGGAAKDDAVGRMIAGSTIMTSAVLMAEGGTEIEALDDVGVTGSFGADYNLKNTLKQATGWQERSFRIGDEYYSYSRYDPVSTIVGFAIDIRDITRRLQMMGVNNPSTTTEKYVGNALKMVAGSMWSNIADKAMLKGLADMGETFMTIQQDIETGADVDRSSSAFRALSNQVARAVVPNIARGYGRARDPYVRDAYTFLETIKDGIPFFRNDLELRVDMFGNPIYLEEYGPAGENLSEDIREMIVNITKKSTRKEETEGKKMLVQLGYRHKRPSRKLTFSGQSVELDSKQYALLEMSSGKQWKYLIEELATNPAYIKAKPTEKQIYLRQIRNAANKFGREIVKIQHGDELLDKGLLEYYRSRRDANWFEELPKFLQEGYLER